MRREGNVLEHLLDHLLPDSARSVQGQDGEDVLADLPAQVVAEGGGTDHCTHGVNLEKKQFVFEKERP